MSAPESETNTAQFSGIASGNRYLSPAALTVNIRKTASALHSVGVWQGDAVALLLRNDFAYFESTQGAALLGAYTVPMNWHMTPEEIAYVLDDSDAKVIIAHSDLLTEAVLAVCSNRELIAVETPAEIVDAYSIAKEKCRVPGAIPEWYRWISSFQEWDEEAMPISQPMFYTSGTTGMPKGVKRKAVSPEIAQQAMRRTGIAFGLLDPPVRSVMCGPLYHSAPNAYGMKVVRDGGLLVLQPRFDPENLLRLIQLYQITHIHMVPTMFIRLLKLDDKIKENYDTTSLKHVVHGAAPCPADVKKQMINWWGPVIHEYYAMTETGIVATCDSHQWLEHEGCVGTAVEGVKIEIIDSNEQPCSSGTPGEICVTSATTPYVAYHRAQQKTNDLRRGTAICTGDVGYLDDDGFLFISDRISDMVISGGVNIYPAEIEKVLVSMPAVKDCAIFGIPDDEYGEALVAIIEVSKELEKNQIIDFLRDHIASYKIPRKMAFVDHLPREDSGKIKKRFLKAAYLNNEII